MNPLKTSPGKNLSRWITKAAKWLLPVVLLPGCSADQDGRQWQLPPQISEISGLANGPDDSVYLHDDEIAVVYQLQLETGAVSTVFQIEQPVIRGDFEGIVSTAQYFFLVTSEGVLYRVERTGDMLDAIVSATVIDPGISDFCEVEGLHERNNFLYIACKTPYLKADKKNIVLLEYNLETNVVTNEIRFDFASLSLKKFNPSAIWLDEQSIILLSAKQHKVIQLNWSGDKLLEFKLDKGKHPQPEGLTIMNDRLVIADEGKGSGGIVTIYAELPAN